MNKMWWYNFPKLCLCKNIIYLSWWINWKYLLAYGFSIMAWGALLSLLLLLIEAYVSIASICIILLFLSFFVSIFPFLFFPLICFFHHITDLINEPHRKIWVLMIISLKFQTKERDIIMTLHVEKQYIGGNGIGLNSR